MSWYPALAPVEKTKRKTCTMISMRYILDTIWISGYVLGGFSTICRCSMFGVFFFEFCLVPRYVFSKCYREDSRASALRADEAFMMELEKIKVGDIFLGVKNWKLRWFFCVSIFGCGNGTCVNIYIHIYLYTYLYIYIDMDLMFI